MFFNSIWSAPLLFKGGSDKIDIINSWSCKDRSGVYAICDQYDSQVLYVGKAENTSCDISNRLKDHLNGLGNKGIGDLVGHKQAFIVRWVESQNPALTESIVIAALLPLFNQRSQWYGGDRVATEAYIREFERLGVGSYELALDKLHHFIYPEKLADQDTPLWERTNPSNYNRDSYRER